MKKTIIFVLIFLSLLVIYELLFNVLKSSHDIDYSIIQDDKTYMINENYVKGSGTNFYYIEVNERESKDKYIFNVKNDFSKRKNIVKEIKEYSKNNISCMELRLINDSDSEAICIKNNELYSYYYLKDELKIEELDKKLKTYEIDEDVGPDTQDFQELEVTMNYFENNEYLIFHMPKDIAIFGGNRKVKHFTFASVDNYKNTYGILVGRYYVIPRIGEETEFNTYLVYNIVDGRSEYISSTINVSVNSFNNGVFDNNLYITDTNNLRQYIVDPASKTIKQIANKEEDAYIFENGEAKRYNIYDVADKKMKFTNLDKKYQDIKCDKIFTFNGYAYYVKDGVFYKVYEKYLDNPVKLFKANNPVNIVVRGNNIYYVEYDKLKKYNDYGINTLLVYNELINNYDNVFDVYINN